MLVLLVVWASEIGLARRGLPLEGWTGTAEEQVLGWTLLTSPYVFIAWLPVAVVAVGTTSLLRVSRRYSVILSIGLAVGLLALSGALA